MSLPKILANHRTITVAGAQIDIRSLTRAEVARLRDLVDRDAPLEEVEIEMVAAGTDTPKDEAREWYGATDSPVVDQVIAAIRDLSRVEEEEAQKSG